jgi:alpha-1,3-rhamnosyl/mannosyltransferase
VGTWGRRKNLPSLIDAFRIFRADGTNDHELILVGPAGANAEVADRLRDPQVASHVRSLGYVPDEDMPGIYAACEALVFPSLAEGFGLPVIEAMACGTPVLVSAVSCLPEVAGDAALFFDPHDPADIARAMKLILSLDLRQELRQKGLQRARMFTWKGAALETEKAYIEALR